MPAKDARPDRYVVDRRGAPDPPSSEYFVFDLVHSWEQREALAYLGNKYRQRGRDGLAQECFNALDATLSAHAEVMEKRNELHRKQSKQTPKTVRGS